MASLLAELPPSSLPQPLFGPVVFDLLAMEVPFEVACIPPQAKEVLQPFPHPEVVLQIVSVQ